MLEGARGATTVGAALAAALPTGAVVRRPLGADAPHLDALRSRRWRGVALVLAGATSAEPAGVHGAVVTAQQLVRRAPPPTLLLLTAGTQRPVALAAPAPLSAAAHGGACGVARVLALEHTSTRVVAADAGGGATDAAACLLYTSPSPRD